MHDDQRELRARRRLGERQGTCDGQEPERGRNDREGFGRPLHESIQDEETGGRRHDPDDRRPHNVLQGDHGLRRSRIEPSRQRDAGRARDDVHHEVQANRDARRDQCPLCDTPELEFTFSVHRPHVVGNKRSVHGMPPCSVWHFRARHQQCAVQQPRAQAQRDAKRRHASRGVSFRLSSGRPRHRLSSRSIQGVLEEVQRGEITWRAVRRGTAHRHRRRGPVEARSS